jgi:GNAT superfamily N-acetyltransferase
MRSPSRWRTFLVSPFSYFGVLLLAIIEITISTFVTNSMLRGLAEGAKNGRSRMFIAKISECDVGFLCYDNWSDKSLGFIYELFVLPEYRGRGIGSKLLSYSEELAKSLHCESIRLEPRPFDRTIDSSWLISWYIGKGYMSIPNDPAKMEKLLVTKEA